MSYKRFVYVTAASAPPETSCATPASASQTLHVCAFGFGPAHAMSERTYARLNFLDSNRASSNCIWGRGWPAERMWPCREVGRQRLPGRCSKLITMPTPRHVLGTSSRTASRSGHIAFADHPRPTLRTSWASASWRTTYVVMDARTMGKCTYVRIQQH